MRRKEKQYRMELEAFAKEIFGGFARWDQSLRGMTYMRGLMREAERKSPGAMATYMTEVNEQALRHFVTDSTWDFYDVRRRQAVLALERLPEEGRFIIFDETGFPKQGKHSVGVARQYCGALGKVGNCQLAVSAHLATKEISVPLDWELYLPESWASDPDRLKKGRVPEGTAFQTKPQLALKVLDRLRDWGIGSYPVLADAAYGNDGKFRAALTEKGHLDMVAVQGSTTVWPGPVPGGPKHKKHSMGRPPSGWDYGTAQPIKLEALARMVDPSEWRTVTWDYGAETKSSRFYRQRVHPAPHNYHHSAWPQPEEWLLIEWPGGHEKPSHYWLSTFPKDATFEELAFAAKLRWRIELDYRQLKSELGLDHFEGRTWPGWNRHVTLVSAAYQFLVYQQFQGKKNG